MVNPSDPYHAHIYYTQATKPVAQRLHRDLTSRITSGSIPELLLVGGMYDSSVGPHPQPQFEIHFLASALPRIVSLLNAAGLTVLVHPLTDDDLADHTTLAQWLGEPLPLDVSVLDPPGRNQGFARFGKRDF